MIEEIIKKEDYIKKIKPNIILNRYDIIHPFDYILINCNGNIVPAYVKNNVCKIGLYLRKMTEKDFKLLVKYIFKKYRKRIVL